MGSAEYRLASARDSSLGRARLLLLGLWGGALLAFGGLFVPAAFSNLPTQLAAEVLRSGFAELDRSGAAIGLSCVALGWFDARRRGARGSAEVLRALLPLAGVLAHATSALWVGPALQALRAGAGGAIGTLGAGDPDLARFASLHSASRGLFGLAAGSAALACLWDLWELRSRPAPGASPDAESR